MRLDSFKLGLDMDNEIIVLHISRNGDPETNCFITSTGIIFYVEFERVLKEKAKKQADARREYLYLRHTPH